MKILEFLNDEDYADFLIKVGYPKISINSLTGFKQPDKQQTERPFPEIRKGGKVYIKTIADYPEVKGRKLTKREIEFEKIEFIQDINT